VITSRLLRCLALVSAAGLGCGGDEPPVSSTSAAVDDQALGSAGQEPEAESGAPPGDLRDPIEAVPDCSALARRAERIADDAALLAVLCPGLSLDHGQTRAVVLALASASAAARAIATLDHESELQGVVRLAAFDRSSQAMPAELPDPATARLSPIDDRTLAAVELAHALLRSPDPPPPPEREDGGRGEDEDEDEDEDPPDLRALRARAHALLARVHLQALQTLELPTGRPLPPLARLLAGPALHHGRNFCLLHEQRRVAELEQLFVDTEVDLLTLLVDLDNTPHAGDPALLAVERHRTRSYLQRPGPRSRIAKRARQQPDARALGTDLLLPLAHELDRLIDQGFVELAVDLGLRSGAEAGGYGLDPMVALLTEALRERDLREYERRLGRRVEQARKTTPKARHEGRRELEPKLPVEWPSAAKRAEHARAWLAVAHGRAPDFARRHAIARAVLALRDRPDAVRAILERAPTDEVVRAQMPLLLSLLDAQDDGSLAALRLRVASATDDREGWVRRSFALASRGAGLF
jgi:hypothetical protein